VGACNKGWAVWFVGLPGCGKSTLAEGVYEYLFNKGLDVVSLQMDKQRKIYFPDPQYKEQERKKAYTLFVDEAAELARQGKGVLMDGTAYELSMRAYARQRISRFAEIFVCCGLEEAIRRESNRPDGLVIAGLYKKALIRKQVGQQFEGLGQVIGVDVEFEVDPDAELTICNDNLSREETLGKALHFLDSWLGND